jgi:HNH endonuclease
MRCIFCKSSTIGCRSEEHIIPESLGNVEHVLPPGWVCDDCNNYFSREVEAPFLNSCYGRHSRFEMLVPSKRGNVPPATGLYAQSRSKVDLYVDKEDCLSICASPGENEKSFIESFLKSTHGTLYIPAATLPPQNYETARFIGKIAMEVLAQRCMYLHGWNNEVVDKRELDELRTYVRRGRPGFIWPVNIRRIYPPDFLFADGTFAPHEILHEWDILTIPDNTIPQVSEYYSIIAIFGVEYAINLGGAELDGFHQWLKDNDNDSLLHSKKKLQRQHER